MSRVGLIDNVVIDPDGVVGAIGVDATITEDHSLEAEVSSYPIEDGSDVVDNVRIKPMSITLDCIFTDTPMDGVTKDGVLPSTDAYLSINRLFQSKKLVAIETSLDRFENMVLVSVSYPRSASNGYALSAKLDFQQVVVIENIRSTVNIPNRGAGEYKLGVYLLAFSRKVAERAKYKGRWLLLRTDNVGPDGFVTSQQWDHWWIDHTINGTVSQLNNIPGANAFNTGVANILADGWVDQPGNTKYHAYAEPTGVFAGVVGDITGIHFDQKSGKWLGDDGKPVTASPGEVSKGSADGVHDRWVKFLAAD